MPAQNHLSHIMNQPKKPTHHKLTGRIILLIVALSIFRLLNGCIFRCNCPETEILDIGFNKTILSNINNSDGYLWYHQQTDSIPAAAIGFSIVLCDSNFYENPEYYFVQQNHIPPTLIKGAYAWECFCNEFDFRPGGKLSSINILTLFDFNTNYPAGSDISHLFVATASGTDFELHNMYATCEELIDWIQHKEILPLPEIKFNLFLKDSPQNDSLRLQFNFKFDDNSFVEMNSSLVHIIP